jgi:hypothetical protein
MPGGRIRRELVVADPHGHEASRRRRVVKHISRLQLGAQLLRVAGQKLRVLGLLLVDPIEHTSHGVEDVLELNVVFGLHPIGVLFTPRFHEA